MSDIPQFLFISAFIDACVDTYFKKRGNVTKPQIFWWEAKHPSKSECR